MSAPTDDGDGMGMHPDFSRPEPAEFVATDPFEILEQYALGWTHGWDDAQPVAHLDGYEAGIRDQMAECERSHPATRSYEMFGHGFAVASVIWALILLVSGTCRAQSFPAPAIQAGAGPFQMGYVVDSARVELEQAWDTRNPRQVERAYCIEPSDVAVDTATDHSLVAWYVHHVHPPEVIEHAAAYSVVYHCSDSAIASIHVHTPTTCRRGVCALGGIDGAVCTVDEQDRMAARHDAFTAIQCDKHAFVFYWPGKRG